MARLIRALLIEDSRADAEIILFELRRGGFEPVFERVETPEALKAALGKQAWDIILSDYELPRFSGPAALKIVRELGIDVPFIVVTGKVGEETAVETMKAGANDYVLKGNLTRLVPAIQRELKDAEVRRERRQAELQDLVETTRLESGRMEMHKTELDLLSFIADTVEHMSATQERERIQVEAPHWVPLVQADRDRIERVVTNLISNALKYSAPNTPVMVRIERNDGQALVSVKDQGVGIAPDALPHLFDRFYRAKATEKTEGLGLGLYISRLIIEAHGGRIWAESEPNKGSTFHFTLPIG